MQHLNESISFKRQLILSNSLAIYELFTDYKDELETKRSIKEMQINADTQEIDIDYATLTDNIIEHMSIRYAMTNLENISAYRFADTEYLLIKYIISTEGQ